MLSFKPSTLVSKINTAARWFLRGHGGEPVWERPALLVILAANAILYCWDLGINGWANYFYSAAVQSGLMDPVAFFFGSSDWGNSITVDKPPLSLWVMGLSARLFGFNPTAILLPQAVIGVATTLLIYAILRRCVSGVAALLGATAFFTTPIVTLMSRYNNPDPLMLLLMVAALWFVLRSVETGRGRFFVVAGVLLGLAFMTKQLQGLLSVPAFGLVYLTFSPQPWVSRLRIAGAAVGGLIVAGGLWMTIVDLIPEDRRPFVGGSPGNSVLQLTLGYNGIERIAGTEQDPSAQQLPPQYRTVDNDAGFFRLLNGNYNQEASWLLFAALLAALWLALTWRRGFMTRATRATYLASSLWLLTAFLLLCFMGNQIHSYYTAALAPPLALVLGIAADELIKRRRSARVRFVGAAIALTASLSAWLILSSTTGWPAWLAGANLGIGIAAISALILRPPTAKVEVTAAGVLVMSLFCGPIITSIHNVATPFNGSNPLSGMLSKNPRTISHLLAELQTNKIPWAHDIAFGRDPDVEVVNMLANSNVCTWAAASYASQSAARLQLESQHAVMPVGGFAGTDPSPTLDEFKNRVAAGEICYFVEQEAFIEVQFPDSTARLISSWVQQNFRSEKIGNTTVYRLAQG
ncbi:glycosyltransferase family 39 protein [Pseudarthrobacter sp. LT1]|uniref:ArnT family glycosyltransferase n=1 Tax=Pseudarthrobacter sp. LT1 TaxID=3111450 RepID=UPI002D76A318|nr:glycosyltransferase family 39 protein [Pseudarthrobacter sp. LT1]WRT12736.1 glycosyltransferase family 39 protein [Pseudarthrobacter sp. LT1]